MKTLMRGDRVFAAGAFFALLGVACLLITVVLLAISNAQQPCP